MRCRARLVTPEKREEAVAICGSVKMSSGAKPSRKSQTLMSFFTEGGKARRLAVKARQAEKVKQAIVQGRLNSTQSAVVHAITSGQNVFLTGKSCVDVGVLRRKVES